MVKICLATNFFNLQIPGENIEAHECGVQTF